MFHDMGDWHWGFGFGHWSLGILLWIVIIIAIVALVRALIGKDQDGRGDHMRRHLTGLLAALLLLPFPGHATVGVEVSDIGWQPYSPQTTARAKQQNRPQFVFIYAQWCQFCERFEKQTLESEPIRARLKKEFIPIALDYDQARDQVKQLGVKLVPTTIILAPDGRQLQRFLGLVSVTELLGIMDKAQQLLQAGGSDEKEFGNQRTCCPLDEAPDIKKRQ